MNASSMDVDRVTGSPWWSTQPPAWGGHLPATRARLTEILVRTVRGDACFTLAERALVTACEFWALVMAGELHTQSELRAVGKLRFASMVYESIGAKGVADALKVAHGDLARLQTRLQRKRRLQMLEARLLVSAQPVDALLARFAEQIGGRSVAAPADHLRPELPCAEDH